MKKLLVLFSLFASVSCNTGGPKTSTAGNEKQEEIFPIGAFFREQVNLVDSLKLPTVKETIIEDEKSTTAISLEEFRMLAQEFIRADISDPSVKKFYRETSFADQSIPSVTLTYSTPDSAMEVQRVDVIIDPDPVSEDKVKSIYIEKHVRQEDTAIVKRLYWKANDNFQVITTKQQPGGKESTLRMKVSWNG